jgi:hypothetical protein
LNQNEQQNGLTGWASVALMFAVWELLDRATVDPEERKLGQAVFFARTLQYISLLPEDRFDLDPQKVIARSLGAEKINEEAQKMVADWQTKIDILLEAGVMPQAIFTVLKRKLFHTPLRKSVESAGVAIMVSVWGKLNKLLGEVAEIKNWHTEEAITGRRKIRQELAEQALLVDLPEKVMPKISSGWLLGFKGK